jgi:hypothetical protein
MGAMIILPRARVAHLASCGHWICLHDKVAEVDGRELCGLCALTFAVLATSLFGDVAAALREHGSATLDEHCCCFRRPD